MALSSTAGSGMPTGYEQALSTQQQGGGYSSSTAVSQLFARLSQEIEEKQPKNCIHFVVDFLCKHYPEHLHGFASIWQMDPDLENERHEVVNFFKAHKISTAVAAHFTNAGYDTLDTLTTLSPDSLVDVEAFNNVKWLPGHKVRLQQIFGEISARVRAYRQQLEAATHPQAAKHHAHHGHHNRHHSPGPKGSAPAAPAYPASASPYHGHAATMAHSPFGAGVHTAHAASHASPLALAAAPYAPQVYTPATVLPEYRSISAGIGHGVMAPSLPAAGNLFYPPSAYPAHA